MTAHWSAVDGNDRTIVGDRKGHPWVALETGFWCHTEGIYFTSKDEHLTKEEWRKTEIGTLGHYGYECAGAEETVTVAIVELDI